MVLKIPMWTEEERDELGAGKVLVSAIKRDLCQAGFEIRQVIEGWDDDGWSLLVDNRGTGIWCTLRASEDWLIQCWPHSGLIDRLKGRDIDAPHREVMDAIVTALSRQRYLSDAQWMPRQAQGLMSASISS